MPQGSPPDHNIGLKRELFGTCRDFHLASISRQLGGMSLQSLCIASAKNHLAVEKNVATNISPDQRFVNY